MGGLIHMAAGAPLFGHFQWSCYLGIYESSRAVLIEAAGVVRMTTASQSFVAFFFSCCDTKNQSSAGIDCRGHAHGQRFEQVLFRFSSLLPLVGAPHVSGGENEVECILTHMCITVCITDCAICSHFQAKICVGSCAAG